MSTDVTTTITRARERAARIRPAVGGFPYMAEALRSAGVDRYLFDVPSATAVYLTATGDVLVPGHLLRDETTVVPPFDADALVSAIRTDQEGRSTFPEFVEASFRAGVVRYEVDLHARECRYVGTRGESYVEPYPRVDLAEDVEPVS